jgi:hypothetical protein
MKLGSIVMGLLVTAALSFAADVDGKWTGTLNTPNGDVPVNLTFKADGATLNGSPARRMVWTSKLPTAKSTATRFPLRSQSISEECSLRYSGAVAKDQIKFTIDILGMPFDLTVKRAG